MLAANRRIGINVKRGVAMKDNFYIDEGMSVLNKAMMGMHEEEEDLSKQMGGTKPVKFLSKTPRAGGGFDYKYAHGGKEFEVNHGPSGFATIGGKDTEEHEDSRRRHSDAKDEHLLQARGTPDRAPYNAHMARAHHHGEMEENARQAHTVLVHHYDNLPKN